MKMFQVIAISQPSLYPNSLWTDFSTGSTEEKGEVLPFGPVRHSTGLRLRTTVMVKASQDHKFPHR